MLSTLDRTASVTLVTKFIEPQSLLNPQTEPSFSASPDQFDDVEIITKAVTVEPTQSTWQNAAHCGEAPILRSNKSSYALTLEQVQSSRIVGLQDLLS